MPGMQSCVCVSRQVVKQSIIHVRVYDVQHVPPSWLVAEFEETDSDKRMSGW